MQITRESGRVLLNLDTEEESHFNMLAKPTRIFVRNFILYRTIRDNPKCKITLGRRQFLITKFLLINLRDGKLWKTKDLKEAVQKDFKEYSRKTYESYGKDVVKIRESEDKVVLRKKNNETNYKLTESTFKTSLLLALRPKILNYKMIYSKKTRFWAISISLTRVGEFLAYVFEKEMEKKWEKK